MADASPHPGWVDTHSHILPGLDDGSHSLEESLAMAEVAREDGIAQIVCTPHANFQYDYDPGRVEAALAQLNAALAGLGPRLRGGCEMHLTFDNVQHVLARPADYTLAGGRYLLVEFPEFFERASMGGVLTKFLHAGLIPVLAHPERNAVFTHHPECLEEYLAFGCLTQITASSFTGRFGKTAAAFSAEMLKRDQVHIVASDAHSPHGRPPSLRGAFDFIARHRDRDIASQVCSANPLAVAENRELPFHPPARSKTRKSFWGAVFGR